MIGRDGAATLLAVLLTTATAAGAQEAPDRSFFDVSYEARLVPTEKVARVSIRIGKGSDRLRWLRFRIDPQRHLDFRGDGEVTSEADSVMWVPPRTGGTLRYRFRVEHLRDERSYDSRVAANWTLFRGDDLVPPAKSVLLRGAESRARLRLRLPEGWSIAAPYDRAPDGSFLIEHPERRFDRPTGWIVAGKLGVVRERVAGVKVAVAGPVGQGLRRLDLLALLRWTLPELRDVVGELPDRLLLVGANDPMWRGGLSGPRSLYVHASRPMITNDGTSPVLHELVHSVLRIHPDEDGDWIVEGLAELYSLELLVRSRTMSRRRFEKVLKRLQERGREAAALRVGEASGAVTARAVGVLRRLDRELEKASDGEQGLDDVVRLLAQEGGRVSTKRFRELAERVAGRSLESFFQRYVPS